MSEAGEVMPQKSTYFYPKIASGIVLNPLDPAESVSPKESGNFSRKARKGRKISAKTLRSLVLRGEFSRKAR